MRTSAARPTARPLPESAHPGATRRRHGRGNPSLGQARTASDPGHQARRPVAVRWASRASRSLTTPKSHRRPLLEESVDRDRRGGRQLAYPPRGVAPERTARVDAGDQQQPLGRFHLRARRGTWPARRWVVKSARPAQHRDAERLARCTVSRPSRESAATRSRRAEGRDRTGAPLPPRVLDTRSRRSVFRDTLSSRFRNRPTRAGRPDRRKERGRARASAGAARGSRCGRRHRRKLARREDVGEERDNRCCRPTSKASNGDGCSAAALPMLRNTQLCSATPQAGTARLVALEAVLAQPEPSSGNPDDGMEVAVVLYRSPCSAELFRKSHSFNASVVHPERSANRRCSRRDV